MFILIFATLAAHAAATFDCDSALNSFLIRPQPTARREEVAIARARGQSWRSAVRPGPAIGSPAETFTELEFALNGAVSDPFAARVIALPGVASSLPAFALFLAPNEVDQVLDGRLPHGVDRTTAEALGYARYFRRGHDLVITEMRSELFASLNDAGRARYRAWPRVLLLAIERFADQLMKDQPWRVVVRVQNGRAPRTLPMSLGYHSTQDQGDAFAFTAGQAASSVHLARQRFADKITFKDRDRLATARADLARATPRFSVGAGGKNPTGAVAGVRFTPLPAALVYTSEGQHRTHERVFRSLPPWTRHFTKHSLLSLARGKPFELQRDVVTLNDRTLNVELPASLTRPAVVALDQHPGLITIHGVGARGLDDSGHVFTPAEFSAVTGGLTESAGIAQFRRHLDLIRLGERAHVEVAVARPLDIGWTDHLPRVTGDARKMVAADDYFAHELQSAADRLVQTRYFVRTTSRASAVEVAMGADDYRSALRPLLREVYAAFDEDLIWPDAGVSTSSVTFLHAVRAANGGAGERILRRWLDRTLGTMAVLHGGGYLLRESAQSNNISLAGEILSVDHVTPVQPFAGLGPLRGRDLDEWNEGYALMQKLLLGLVERDEENLDPLFRFARENVLTHDTYEGSVYRHALLAIEAAPKD